MRRQPTLLFSLSLLLIGTLIACSKSETPVPSNERSTSMVLKLTSSGFAEGQSIPSKYTCDGEDISPPLTWAGIPRTARSLALICEDPDAPAGTWVHWLLYDLTATTNDLPEAIETTDQALNGARQGRNDFDKIGYGGPCPPKGSAHRYYFKLYALDRELGLKPGATKSDVQQAMNGHIVGEARLMGTYRRM